MNRGRRWGKNEKKTNRNRRTQCKETDRNQKLGQRRGRNHTSWKTKNDPKPTQNPPSSPERPAVSQTARRSLWHKRRNRADEVKKVREEETKRAPREDIKRTGSLRAKSSGHCHNLQYLQSMSTVQNPTTFICFVIFLTL